MREYKKYEEYKDSGVEWIGTIPNEWEVERFRTLTKNIQNGKWGEEAQNNGDDIYCVRVADYNREKNIVEDQEFTIRNLDKSSREELLLEKDDLLLEKSGGGDKQPVGFVAQYKSEKPAIYANFMAKIEPRKEYIKTDYLKHVNISIYQKREILKVINQTTGIQNLDTKRYLEIESPLPSKSEQQKIASFLDKKTAEIDEIINKKEILIDHLEKYKKSVITEAVTKGKLGDKYINEDGELVDEIKMKDSGIEWIGEIPKFIDAVKIKRLTQIKRGASPRPIDNPIYFDDNGKYSWVRISDVTRSDDYLLETEQTLSKLGASKSVKMDEGDIFLSIAATVGKPIITKIKCCIHDGFVYFPEYNENKKFLFYIFKSEQPYRGLGKHGTQINLNTTIVGDIKIPYFKKSSQEKIANYLDQKTTQINNLINKTKQSTEKYKKYKRSLIFEAVTGKIDLRDYELEGGEELAEHNYSSETKRERLSAVD